MRIRTKVLLVGLPISMLAGVPVVLGQFPATSQVTKDGTSVLIEDYATVPASSLMRDGPYPAPLDARFDAPFDAPLGPSVAEGA